MRCSGTIKYKQGRKVLEAKCPHNKWRCEHYATRGKREPTEVKTPIKCNFYNEYYDWT